MLLTLRSLNPAKGVALLAGTLAMLLSDMKRYISDRGIARNPLHSASRFVRFMGDVRTSQITTEMLKEFRKRAEAAGLAAWTIRGTLKDIRTLIRWAGGSVGRGAEPGPGRGQGRWRRRGGGGQGAARGGADLDRVHRGVARVLDPGRAVAGRGQGAVRAAGR